jgi:hypothetical protein
MTTFEELKKTQRQNLLDIIYEKSCKWYRDDYNENEDFMEQFTESRVYTLIVNICDTQEQLDKFIILYVRRYNESEFEQYSTDETDSDSD